MHGASDFAVEENADEKIRGDRPQGEAFSLYIRVGEINEGWRSEKGGEPRHR